jgi:hypothetical protein
LAISYAIENEDTRAQAWKGIRETLIISVRPWRSMHKLGSIFLGFQLLEKKIYGLPVDQKVVLFRFLWIG